MAHIPESARYVDPPSEREVDEDVVTDEAMDMLCDRGWCPSCKVDGPFDEDAFHVWVDEHAEKCGALRAKAEDRLYGEGE